MVKRSPTRLASEKPWTEVKYGNRKDGMAKKRLQKQKSGGRRILFLREEGQEKMSEEDIMLALNEALQKAEEATSICFSQVSYLLSGAISAFLIEKEMQANFSKPI